MLRRSPSTLHLSHASSSTSGPAAAAEADLDSDADAASIAHEVRATSGQHSIDLPAYADSEVMRGLHNIFSYSN